MLLVDDALKQYLSIPQRGRLSNACREAIPFQARVEDVLDAPLKKSILDFALRPPFPYVLVDYVALINEHGPSDGRRMFIGYVIAIVLEFHYEEWFRSAFGRSTPAFPCGHFTVPAVLTFFNSMLFGHDTCYANVLWHQTLFQEYFRRLDSYAMLTGQWPHSSLVPYLWTADVGHLIRHLGPSWALDSHGSSLTLRSIMSMFFEERLLTCMLWRSVDYEYRGEGSGRGSSSIGNEDAGSFASDSEAS